MYRPLIAYRFSELDPSRARGPDEGERRLLAVRIALRAAASANGALHGFADPSTRACFANHLIGRGAGSATPQLLAAISDTVLVSPQRAAADAAKHTGPYPVGRPRVRLVQQQIRCCGVGEADHFDEATRRASVPIQGTHCVALPDQAPVGDGARPFVELMWPQALGVAAGVKDARRDAALIITRVAADQVLFRFYDFQGREGPLLPAEVPPGPVAKLFERRADDPKPPPPPPLLGRQPSHRGWGPAPDYLVAVLAAFAQERLRLHVLTTLSAALPTGRSFTVDRGEFRTRQGRARGHDPLTLRLMVHPTSATCLCGAHNLPSMESRHPGSKFTGSDVIVDFTMCGMCADPSNACPRHTTKCEHGICCAHAGVVARCRHFVDGGGARNGLVFDWRSREVFPAYVYEELTAILASAAAYEQALDPAHRPPAELLRRLETDLTAKLQRLERERAAAGPPHVPTDADLLRLDLVCMQQLQLGELGRVHVQGQSFTNRATQEHDTQRIGTPNGLTGKGKPTTPVLRRLEPYHARLFPAPGARLYRLPDEDEPSLDDGGSVFDGDVDESASTLSLSNAGAPTPSKRPRRDFDTLDEYLDVEGIAEARRQIKALLAARGEEAVTKRQRERATFYLQFLEQMEESYSSAPVEGPREIQCLYLEAKYARKGKLGRLYTTNTKTVTDWSKDDAPRAVCLQGAPKELRPFLCARLCRDYDMANAQPVLLRQLARQLQWRQLRDPPAMAELEDWCEHRDAYIAHVAEVHALASDDEKGPDYRKGAVKNLVLSLIFGGVYEGWLAKHDLDRSPTAPRSPKIVKLQRELAALREAVFTSLYWAPHVEEQRERLRRAGQKTSDDAIDRSVFALIAQTEEDRMLVAMRHAAAEQGFQVLSLQFDGMFVREKPGRTLNLPAVRARIKAETGYDMDVVEKPLFSDAWPTLSLKRSSGDKGKGKGKARAGGPGRPALLEEAPSPLFVPSPATAALLADADADPVARHDAIVADLDPSVPAAGIVPLAADGLWLALQKMPTGPAKWGDLGGKRAAGDANLWETAVREAYEESGLDFRETLLHSADQVFYGTSRTGISYVFFFVATDGAPGLTGDPRIVEHRIWRQLPDVDALHSRMRYATKMRVRLAECFASE